MPEPVTSSEGRYDIVRPGEALPDDFKREYWRRVRRALIEVFHGDPSLADRLRDKVENDASPDTRTIFYHADPFEVAADLAGRRGQAVSAAEKSRYLTVESAPDRPSREALRQTHPEHPTD